MANVAITIILIFLLTNKLSKAYVLDGLVLNPETLKISSNYIRKSNDYIDSNPYQFRDELKLFSILSIFVSNNFDR